MVKICPSCGAKNFDDAKRCVDCYTKLKNVASESWEKEETTKKVDSDEFKGLKPRGYTPQPWQGSYYSRAGLLFALLYLVFLFIFPLMILLLTFSFLPIILGFLGYKNGDKAIGKFTTVIGIILLILTIVLTAIKITNF